MNPPSGKGKETVLTFLGVMIPLMVDLSVGKWKRA
jgi:hypothetical protein